MITGEHGAVCVYVEMAAPDVFDSYEPGLWWAKGFYDGERFSDRLLVSMSSRTTASPTGKDKYVF